MSLVLAAGPAAAWATCQAGVPSVRGSEPGDTSTVRAPKTCAYCGSSMTLERQNSPDTRVSPCSHEAQFIDEPVFGTSAYCALERGLHLSDERQATLCTFLI
jgi:hypothetical protein